MPKFVTPPIPNVGTIDVPPSVTNLQRKVVGAFHSLVSQINASSFTDEAAPADLDMGGHRIQNVSIPAADGDAVNLGFLKRSFKGGSQTQVAASDGFYEIVFFTGGEVATGTAAQYNVGINRTGTPIEANISALSPPAGAAIKVNFLVNGTTTLLASDLTLPIGTSTVVSVTNFNSGITLAHNDMVMLLINQTGSTIIGSRVSVGLVVRRG